MTAIVRRAEVLLSIQRALLGEVTPAMRAVTVQFDEGSVRILFYFDGDFSDVDREAASRVETEVMADMSDPSSVSSACRRIDPPSRIEDAGTWVFARNEE